MVRHQLLPARPGGAVRRFRGRHPAWAGFLELGPRDQQGLLRRRQALLHVQGRGVQRPEPSQLRAQTRPRTWPTRRASGGSRTRPRRRGSSSWRSSSTTRGRHRSRRRRPRGGWFSGPLLCWGPVPLRDASALEADLGARPPTAVASHERRPRRRLLLGSSRVRRWFAAGRYATGAARAPPRIYRYHLKRRVPPSLESVQKYMAAGTDEFPEEKEAEELSLRLGEMGRLLREGRVRDVPAALLAPAFRGGRLTPTDEVSLGNSPRLEVFRARSLPTTLTLDGTTFGHELLALVEDFDSLETTEFLITAIEVTRPAGPRGPHDPAVRPLGHGPRRGPHRPGGPLADALAPRPGRRLARDRVDGARRTCAAAPRPPSSPKRRRRRSARTPRSDEQLVPGPRRVGGEPRRALHAAGHGAPRRVGRRLRRGRPRRHLRLAAGGASPTASSATTATAPSRTSTAAAGLGVLERTSESLFADVDNDGDEDVILLTRTGPELFVNDGKGHFARDARAFQFKQRLKGSLTSGALADYDRDGFLDLYLCAYGYYIGVSEDKAGPPSPYHDALNGSPNVLLHNDGHGHFVETTDEVGLDQNNDRFSFAPAWADYDEDGWPDLFVANDFGRKNLYRNEGMVNGQLHFKDVAAPAGVEDYGAGMSATWLDYDNDGHLDAYAGNMWTAAGQRVTALPGFKPDASPRDAGDLPPARPRQLALPQPGRRHVRGRDGCGGGGVRALGVVVRRLRFRQRRLGGPLRRERHVHPQRRRPLLRRGQLLLAPGGGPVAARAQARDSLRRRLARDEPPADEQRGAGPARAQRAPAQRRPRRVRGRLGHRGPRRRPGRPILRGVRLRRRRPARRGAARAPLLAAAAPLPQRVRGGPLGPRPPPDRHEEQPRRGGRAGDGRDRGGPRDPGPDGGLRVPLAALEGAAVRAGPQPSHREGHDPLAERPRADAHGRPDRPPGAGRRRQRQAAERAVTKGERARRPWPLRRRPPRPARASAASGSTSRSPHPTSRCATSTARSTRCPAGGRPTLLLFWAHLGPSLARAPAGARAPAPGHRREGGLDPRRRGRRSRGRGGGPRRRPRAWAYR